MSFIRTKTIKGNDYLYEVATRRQGGKVLQRQRYLGKVRDLDIPIKELRDLFTPAYFAWETLVAPMSQTDNTRVQLEAIPLAEKLQHIIASLINQNPDLEIVKVPSKSLFEMLLLMEDIGFYAPRVVDKSLLMMDNMISAYLKNRVDGSERMRTELYKQARDK